MRDIRILIVDDHGLFRESLGRLLQAEDGLSVVGECPTAPDAIAAFAGIQADVVLLDYDLGDEQGDSLLAELKKCQKDAKALFVTAGLPDSAAFEVIEAGAAGIFFKHSSLDKLISAIHRVANGEISLETGTVRALIAARKPSIESIEASRPLTARQSEVMRGILDGFTNKEISSKLNVSESSVKAVIQELFQKAGVRTRSQLVRIAIEKHSRDWLKAQIRE